MSTSTASLSQRQNSKLPLGLQPYHLTFVAYLSSIVLLGTFYSIAYGTHLQNVRISSGAGQEQFPSTLPGGATAPAPIKNGVDGNTNFGPIPPTIVLPPHHALNYWANRKNIVNQIFVKKAWLWTTLAWGLQLFALRLSPTNKAGPSAGIQARSSAAVGARAGNKKDEDGIGATQQPAGATITSPVSISVLRYLVATSAWLLFANWFFGPPLTERILTATGAVCVPSSDPQSPVEELYCRTRAPLSSSTHPALFASNSSLKTKGIRAMWKGGHDISGHTFIMVLSSLLLLEDIAPYLAVYLRGSSIGKALFPGIVSAEVGRTRWTTQAKIAVASTLALVGLWSWMLLNTAIYFHTPQEKVSGLFVGLAAWLILPKGN